MIAGRSYALVTYPENPFGELTAQLGASAGKPVLIINDIAPNPDTRLLAEQSARFADLAEMPEVIIALGGGPTYVGMMSGFLTEAHGEVHALRISITTLIVPYILSVIAFFWAAKTLPKDWAEADARNKEMAKG